MRLLDNLRVARFAAQINEAADAIAAAVFPSLWRRVGLRASQMRAAEARGYLVAHGGPAIRARAEAALLTRPRLGAWAYAPLCERATAELLRRAAAETIHSETATRRAA